MLDKFDLRLWVLKSPGMTFLQVFQRINLKSKLNVGCGYRRFYRKFQPG